MESIPACAIARIGSMAIMLVTSTCARRPSAAGVFVLEVSAAGEAAAASFAIATSSWFRVSPLGCSPPLVHCFWIVSACFSRCSLLFRADCFFSRDYMVLYCIFADFRPVNRLYFLWAKILAHFSRVHKCVPEFSLFFTGNPMMRQKSQEAQT